MGRIVKRPFKEGVGEKPETPKPDGYVISVSIPAHPGYVIAPLATDIAIHANGGVKPSSDKPKPTPPIAGVGIRNFIPD